MKFSNKFARQFGKQELLVPHVNNWFARGKFPDDIPIVIHPNKEKDDAFHPSSALECARVSFAQRQDLLAPTSNTMDQQKIFMFGHYIHGLVYHIVQDLGFTQPEDIERMYTWTFETPHGNHYEVRGAVDIARCAIPGQPEPLLVDIKSQRAREFVQQEPSSGLLEKYSAQVQLYLEFVGLPKAIIFWAEKDSPHRFKETVISPDPVFVDEILSKWDHVIDCEAEGIIPDCTCGRHDCGGKFLEEAQEEDIASQEAA